MRRSTPQWLWRLDAEHRLVIALGTAIVAFLLSQQASLATRFLTVWDAAASCFLILTWSVIATAHPRQIQIRAQTDDTNRLVVGVVVLGAALFSLLAVIFLLSSTKNLPPLREAIHVALSVLAVACSWFVVHTIFCFRYAHRYYSSQSPETKERGFGLDFPDDAQPDYLDFAYFAFVIGMTAQVSDVQVTSRTMRRLVLLHGILSFGFNTVVVALSINIIAQLFN